MNSSPRLRKLAGRIGVWAQVNHPVATSNLMRKLTSSSSSSKAKPTRTSDRIAGVAAANAAAGVPAANVDTTRTSGVALANRAARIPGCY